MNRVLQRGLGWGWCGWLLLGGSAGLAQTNPPFTLTATLNPAAPRQVMEGFGAAAAFYQNWLTAHPYRNEIYTNLFPGLGLDILRLGNWFRYPSNAVFDADSVQIVSNANRVLGYPVPILMSSWSPPAFLKSNGQTGNGGTLASSNGVFNYAGFGAYWHDALRAYRSNGIHPSWISIQNEPDYAAGWDSCVLHPTEDTVQGTNYASYALALEAVHQRLQTLTNPPGLLGPEVVGTGYNTIQNYAAQLDPSRLAGVAHHLYHGGSITNPDSFLSSLRAVTNVFPGKPRWQTEYSGGDFLQTAWLIHNAVTVEEVTAYLYWDLFWDRGGLVALEFPWDSKRWTNAPAGSPTQSRGYWLTDEYFALKHFAFFTARGCRRVSATSSDTRVLVSAFLSADGARLVSVLINKDRGFEASVTLVPSGFGVRASAVYQTAGTNRFARLGEAGAGLQVHLPPASISTVVLDRPATNPVPVSVQLAGLQLELSWPADHTGWRLLLQTNTPGSANWTAVAGSATTNRVRVPLQSGSAGAFYKLVYP